MLLCLNPNRKQSSFMTVSAVFAIVLCNFCCIEIVSDRLQFASVAERPCRQSAKPAQHRSERLSTRSMPCSIMVSQTRHCSPREMLFFFARRHRWYLECRETCANSFRGRCATGSMTSWRGTAIRCSASLKAACSPTRSRGISSLKCEGEL